MRCGTKGKRGELKKEDGGLKEEGVEGERVLKEEDVEW